MSDDVRQRKHRGGSALPLNKASWQKVEEDNDTSGSIFKQRKAVSRKSSFKGSKQSEKQVLGYSHDKDSCHVRPSTTTGFEDFFDATENSKKQRALKAKGNLQELKQAAQWHQNFPQRNCTSVLEEKYDYNKKVKHRSSDKGRYIENGDDDELDFTDKIKAFRALINPKPRNSKHDISNEQLKRAKSFSDGIEKVGNHVRFNAESSDFSEIRSSTPARLVTEFQITYAHDRDRERRGKRPSSPQSFIETEHQVNFISDSVKDTESPVSTRSRRQNELQMTYERDRDMRRHKGEFDSSHSHLSKNVLDDRTPYGDRNMKYFSESESHDVYSQSKNLNSDNLSENRGLILPNQTQGAYLKTGGCRIIKRPQNSRQDKENTVSENKYFGYRREILTERALSAREVSEFKGVHSSSEMSFDDALASRMSHLKRSYSATPLRSSSQDHITSSHLFDRYSSSPVTDGNTQDANRNFLPDRSQSATPTSGKIRSNIGPSSWASGSTSDLGIPEPSASLKTHLNILGASLSSLSSRLNSGSESDLRSLASESDRSSNPSFTNGNRGEERNLASSAFQSVRSGGRDGLMMYGSHSTRVQGSAGFDVSNVRVGLRDKHNLQTWSSSTDILTDAHNERRRELRPENLRSYSHSDLSHKDHHLKEGSVSDSITVDSTHSSKLGSCDSRKQTNVKVYDADEEMSSKYGDESDSLMRSQNSVSSRREKRKEELKKMVNLISRQRDSLKKYKKGGSTMDEQGISKQRSKRTMGSELSDNSNFNSASDISDADDDATYTGSQSERVAKVSLKGDNKSSSRKPVSDSVKVISRKIPLKALHSASSEAEQTRSNQFKTRTNDKHSKPALEKELKEKSQMLEKSKAQSSNDGGDESNKGKKKIIVKRPQGKSTHASTESKNISHKPLLSQKESRPSSQLRSKSALGLFSTSEDSVRNSPLPSKHNIHKFRDQQRSQSSLDTLSQSPRRSKNQVQAQLTGRLRGRNTSDTEAISKEKRDLLRTKVQKLHREVDDRLGSKENLAHSASFYKKIHGNSESSEELSDSSTVVNEDSDSDEKKIKAHKANINHKLSSSTFITSTPLKDQEKKRKPGDDNSPIGKRHAFKNQNSTSEDSVGDDKELEKASQFSGLDRRSMKVLASNMRKIIESRNRMTPEILSGYSIKHTSALDEDADEDDLESASSYRHRSGSVGAQHRSEVNKKDTLSRILTKMSNSSLTDSSSSLDHERNGHKNITKWVMQSNGVNIHGRDSPAESLLNHLDNPNMVKLLQKLYKADPVTRQIIMIKVQFFKAWQYYAVSSREQRLRKESLSKKADAYLLERLLFYHFATWHIRATHSRNMRRAKALFRTHMLTKGFKALRWSVSQSRHQSEKLLTKVHSIMLKVTFQKWKTKAETQRMERIQNAMKCWKQFVMETQKIRHMQEVQDSNVMANVLKCWKKRYNHRQKMNTAFSYLRQTLLKHTINSWKSFVAQSTEKKEKCTSAVSQHQHSLLKTTFYTMLVTYKKSKKAKSHFRSHKLSEMFWAWKEGTQVCRAERQQDMAVSREHWVKWKIKECFVHWRDKLMLCRAEKKANHNICKNAFLIWQKSWRDTVAHQEEIELAALRHKLQRSLLTWRQNVVQLQRRQKMAISLIENCHLRQTFRIWRLYTAARGILVKKALLHRIAHQRKALSSSFLLWQESYNQRKEEEHSKLLWSQACARKIAAHWKLVCHRRSLSRLYELTQPEREQRLLKALFSRWIHALERRNVEKQEAEDTRKVLELCQLRRKFHLWQIETRRVLTIKPMVLRREKQRVSECFEQWRSFVQQKSRCKHSKAIFQQKMLKKAYLSWRRHYQACQIEKKIRTGISQGLLMCLFEEWKFLIVRKRKGVEFRNEKLVQRMFCSWRNRASVQFTHRARLEREAKDNLELKQHYFNQWLENVRSEISATDHCVGQFIFKQNGARLVKAFVTWRQLMHSTLIARAYQKTQSQRLLLTLFLAWHETTSHSTQDAVHRFSERIGLIDNKTPRTKRMELGMAGAEDDDIFYDEDDWNKSLAGSINSSVSFGSTARRLFGEGDHSLDTDGDRMILLSGGLQASVNDHQMKCQRLKDTVTTAVRRLMHWPLCLAFEQWKEFTARERHLKTAAKQIRELHSVTEVTLAFREWKQNYMNAKKARHFWNKCLLTSSLGALQTYKNHRKYVKGLSKTAHHHHMLVVCNKVFPHWLQKTQDLRQEKHILHLWTCRTAREMELLPLENQLTKKLGQRSLLECFTLWLEKYRGVAKIRRVYHNSLIFWLFTSWRDWSVAKHGLVVKSQTFLHRRQTKMGFQKWCERLRQSQESERRYHQAWKNYLHLILQQWRLWANANHRLHLCQQLFEVQQSKRNLAVSFLRWKSLAEKVKGIRGNQMQKLTHSVFSGWRRAVIQSNNEKQKILRFQVHSYTLLVQRLFHQWHSAYRERQAILIDRRLHAEQCALAFARVWRKKAVKTRGQRLKIILQKRHTAIWFQQWQNSFFKTQVLYDILDVRMQEKNSQIIRKSLRIWRMQLIGDRARKIYSSRVLLTLMSEWRSFAKVSKERRIRGLALKKALQERSLHVYFQYWVGTTRVKQSVQHNVETKLQMRILRSWRFYTRTTRYLRDLQAHFTQRVNTRILSSAFTTMRWRADYCAGLQEISDKVVRDRERATMRAVMVMWRDRLDNILAARCYGQILVVRVARQWQRFVLRRNQERQREKENWEKAVKCHQRMICKKIFASLKLEVTVSNLAKKRRQSLCNKYAMVWKARVDLSVTAASLECEFASRKAWNKWRVEYARRCSSNKVVHMQSRQVLTQIFNAWRKLCRRSSARFEVASRQMLESKPQSSSPVSMLPVPISQSRSTSPGSSFVSASEMSFGFKGGRRY